MRLFTFTAGPGKVWTRWSSSVHWPPRVVFLTEVGCLRGGWGPEAIWTRKGAARASECKREQARASESRGEVRRSKVGVEGRTDVGQRAINRGRCRCRWTAEGWTGRDKWRDVAGSSGAPIDGSRRRRAAPAATLGPRGYGGPLRSRATRISI